MKKILIIEDDTNLGTTVVSALEVQGYETRYLTGSEKINFELENFDPDIVLLDVMLNETKDGFDIAKEIRISSNVPIVFTTSLDGNDDFKTAFGIANTDYIRKPYGVMELLMRIEKLLEKQVKVDSYEIGQYVFHPKENALKIDCDVIHLTNLESMVLSVLCAKTCEFVCKDDIVEQVWKEEDAKSKEGSLNNIISNLRKYLKKDNMVVIETKVGLGVKLIRNNITNPHSFIRS
jgi:DNA-binding response OmpR family regulator